MELNDAKELALKLMHKHSLLNWRFDFNQRKRAYGLCSYTKKTIFLSSVLVQHMKEDQVKNTILHEIAHGLVGSGHGHNDVWRNKAIEIGCNGQRCSNHNVDIDAKYLAECCDCKKVYKAHRRPKRGHWCRCSNHSFRPELKLQYIQQY